jgi:hypothetical protein
LKDIKTVLYDDNARKGIEKYNVRKGWRSPRPQPGVIKLFLASLISDIPTGDRKIANLFYSVAKHIKVRGLQEI